MYFHPVKIAIVLDPRTKLKDGSFHVALYLCHKRKQRYFSTGIKLTKKEFERITTHPAKSDFSIVQKLSEIETTAKKIINSLENFSFEEFKRQMFKEKLTSGLIDYYTFHKKHIETLKKNGKFSTCEIYTSSLRALERFAGTKLLKFETITPDFLHEFERFHLKNGMSITTISIYTRTIQRIFNETIETGLLDRSVYPFGCKKYKTPEVNNVKKALTKEELQKLVSYEPNTRNKAIAKDFFLLSYFCNGINFTDLLILRQNNLRPGQIVFVRQKITTSTNRKFQEICINLIPPATEIIKRYQNTSHEKNAFIFPFLSEKTNSYKIKRFVNQFTQNVNKNLRRIAKEIDINQKITSYYARHTFATVMANSGAPIHFISECLGHSNILTTQTYLSKLADTQKIEYLQNLIEFTKNHITK